MSPRCRQGIGASTIEAGDTTATEIRCWVLISTEYLFPQRGITRQQPQCDHAVRFAAAHRLGKQKDRRTCAGATQMPECPIHQREHAVGEVVFLEEFRTIDLPFEEGIEVENRGTAIRSEYGLARLAEGVEAHGRFGRNRLMAVIGFVFVQVRHCPTKPVEE